MFSLIPKFSPPPHPPSLNILLFCPSFLLPHSSPPLPSHLYLVSSLRPLLPPIANRTEPNIQDLAMAFSDLGINTAELLEFCRFQHSAPPAPSSPPLCLFPSFPPSSPFLYYGKGGNCVRCILFSPVKKSNLTLRVWWLLSVCYRWLLQ